MSTNIKQLEINQIESRSSSFFIICTLVGKSDPRYFIRNQSNTNSNTSATSKNNNGVQTISVRDSRGLINCKIWGSEAFIGTINQRLHIGDIIKIRNPAVTVRKYNEYDPHTSTQFLLTISESKGDILSASENSLQNDLRTCSTSVLNKPIKPTSAAMRLSDINSRGTRSSGELFDLLVAVQRLRPTRQFQGQRKGCVRDVIVMDSSFHGMTLKIWNAGYVER